MAWNDKLTYNQIEAVWRWLEWRLPTGMAKAAVRYLESHTTRRTISDEMGRIRDLYRRHITDPEEYFAGDIWKGFNWKEFKK